MKGLSLPRSSWVAVLLIAVASLSADVRSWAVSPELLRATPREVVAAVFVDFSGTERPDPSATSLLGAATGLLQQLRAAGLLDEDAGLLADVLGSLGVLGDYPLAVVVTDVRAQPAGEDSFQLADLQAAIIVRTNGVDGRITSQIQKLLSAYTSAERARIERHEAFATTVYTLVDDRLPGWARLRWAAHGDFYVVALGERAFDAVARCIRGGSGGLAGDALFQRQHRAIAGETANVEWMLELNRIEERLADISTGRVARVRAALGLGDIDRATWAIGRDGRAITAAAIYGSAPGDRLLRIASRIEPGDPLGRLVPPEADAYAVIAYPPQRLVRHVRDAYLSSRRPQVGDRLRAAWAGLEASKGFSVELDLYAHLGQRIVIHTYPAHPLGIPFFVTVLFEIDGSPQRVRDTLDKVLTQCAEWLAGGERADANGPDATFALRLQHDADGVWYLQAGINGPGLAVVDRWIVVSYSPYAVRQNVALINALPASAPDVAP